MGMLDYFIDENGTNELLCVVNVQWVLQALDKYNITLIDAAETNTLPSITANTPVKTIIQTIRNNLKWLFNNHLAKTGVINTVCPVGSIYMSVNNINPGTYLTGTTWVAWGSGRVPVGVNSSDTAFNSAEKTGGAKTHTLTTDEIPSHSHTFTGSSAATDSTGSHTHEGGVWIESINYPSKTPEAYHSIDWKYHFDGNRYGRLWQTSPDGHGMILTDSAGSHQHNLTASGSIGSTGSNQAHNNLQPYITCYMFKRIS